MGAWVKSEGSPRPLKTPGPYFSLENRPPKIIQWQPYSPVSPQTPKPYNPFPLPGPPPEHHPGEYPDTSATPTISPVSLPPSLAQPTAGGGGGGGRQNWGRHGKGKGGAGNGVKEVATVFGEARWEPQTCRGFVLTVWGHRVNWFEARGIMFRLLERA